MNVLCEQPAHSRKAHELAAEQSRVVEDGRGKGDDGEVVLEWQGEGRFEKGEGGGSQFEGMRVALQNERKDQQGKSPKQRRAYHSRGRDNLVAELEDTLQGREVRLVRVELAEARYPADER